VAAFGARIRAWFGAGSQPDYEALEDILLEADFGPRLAEHLVGLVRAARPPAATDLAAALAAEIARSVSAATLEPAAELTVVVALGVNGVGKTTSVAKLARHFAAEHQVLLAAADTFRAAASEQLLAHGKALGLPVIHQERGADAAAVVFDALASARRRGADLVLVDTAGRMHNRKDLVREVQKVAKVIGRSVPRTATHHLLVVDATSGQTAIEQARVFDAAVGVDSVLLAKFDASAKGGAAVAIGHELGIPLSFLGTGEANSDLAVFSVEKFVAGLFAP
jgi:fused signal recognition particle receptor